MMHPRVQVVRASHHVVRLHRYPNTRHLDLQQCGREVTPELLSQLLLPLQGLGRLSLAGCSGLSEVDFRSGGLGVEGLEA